MYVRTITLNLARVSLIALVVALLGCNSTNKAETKSELTLRAESGDADARYQLGHKYANAVFSDDAKAIYWLCQAARVGHVPAQLELAMLYAEDASIGKQQTRGSALSNRGSAYFWYTAAASQGSDEAFTNRDALAAKMDEEEIMQVKSRATRWQQAVCVKP